MAEMGPVRKIDDLGRVVIPKEFRKTFNWPIGITLPAVNEIFSCQICAV